MIQEPNNQANMGTSQRRVVMDVLAKHGVPVDAVRTEGESTIVVTPGAGLSDYQQLIREADWFPGEFEAVADEFCGRFPIGLEQLPPVKRERVSDWLSFPREKREAAFKAASQWALRPVSAALDLLKNPAKYEAPQLPQAKPAQAEPAKPDYSWW